MHDYDGDGFVDGVVVEDVPPINRNAIEIPPVINSLIKVGVTYAVCKALDAILFLVMLAGMYWLLRNEYAPILGLPVLLLRIFWYFPMVKAARNLWPQQPALNRRKF